MDSEGLPRHRPHVAVLGAGIQGSCAALELARRGCRVDLYERDAEPINGVSRWNEGKIHLGLLWAKDDPAGTARTMLRGALAFRDALARWIDLDGFQSELSDPYLYAVHRESIVTPDTFERHLAAVESEFLSITAAHPEANYLGERPASLFRSVDVAEAGYDPERVSAAFATPERSVDPHALRLRLTQALRDHPAVELRLSTDVDRVEDDRAGRLRIVASPNDEPGPRYDHVVNALWADRLRVDAARGIAPRRRWLFRHKLGLAVRPCEAVPLPSTTFVLGSFGDLAIFPDWVYLSWYPAGRIATARTLTPPWERNGGVSVGERVTARTTSALAELIPALAKLELNGNARVGGGTIFSWGETDIDDPASALHRRREIGVHSHGAYHSVDTGKFTLAPAFAIEVADRIAPAGRP